MQARVGFLVTGGGAAVAGRPPNRASHRMPELIRIRIAERTKTLMPTEKVMADMELVIGRFISKLSSKAPRIARLAGTVWW